MKPLYLKREICFRMFITDFVSKSFLGHLYNSIEDKIYIKNNLVVINRNDLNIGNIMSDCFNDFSDLNSRILK